MKGRIAVLGALVLLATCTACGGKTAEDITFEQLAAANTLPAVMERVDSVTFGTEEEWEENSHWKIWKEDGEIFWTHGREGCTSDYIGGAVYSQSDTDPVVWLLPDDRDPLSLVDALLEDYVPSDVVKRRGDEYTVKMDSIYEEYGIRGKGVAHFDAQTLLLTKFRGTWMGGFALVNSTTEFSYDTGESWPLGSYEAITQAEDAVDVTVHYPDGTARDYRMPRNTELVTHHSPDGSVWSVCCDEACTKGINDLGWVEGSRADVYFCKGDVTPMPPALERVLQRSSFDYIMENEYGSYGQFSTYYDGEDQYLHNTTLAWVHCGEHDALERFYESGNWDTGVDLSYMALDGARYIWSAEAGYQVDLYEDEAYVEALMAPHLVDVGAESVAGEMERREWYYSVNRREELPDGGAKAYEYCVHSELDCIDLVYITTYDPKGDVTMRQECSIGGNLGFPVERDIFLEITEPEDVDVVKLTVVTPAGEREYRVREDAALFWEGGPVWQDAACTRVAEDLRWVQGRSATVYVK